ncbi:iron uptake porin [Synechococcus sp. MVIR-18-1]|uniref:iron uptake porin n=1 Tax=Synechococcus sp. MVIR-18-1 TaxID=1386941 RepID=UPI001648E3AB|nr:iron uptake porin [Synechococcus sp. MVIR-18-1]QNI77697.1 outer membrane porin [Synechococcus sp. MVIR-18-1]
MKLFHQLLVAPAALGLLAPVAANATELNINGVSDYAATGEQVTSITQFSDVYPTDWAYQALSNLIERYGCVAGYPNGTYRGNRAMTRFEAAALLNACLDRVTEVTDELKRLMKEFEKELAILKGRVDGLEARVGELEATQFSTTTKLKGQATFVLGANSFSGNAEQGAQDLAVATFTGTDLGSTVDEGEGFRNGVNGTKRARAAAATSGATSFNYDLRLFLDTSFTGKDLLRTMLRAGNFGDSAFSGGGYVGLDAMETAFEEGSGINSVGVNRLWYQFPIGDSFTATVGGLVRQDDMLAVWPSAYPADTVLDFFTYAGAPATYNLGLGQGAGISWESDDFSISANYLSTNGFLSDPNAGGFATDAAGSNGTVQIAYAPENWGLAAAYNYTSQNAGTLYAGNGTPLAVSATGDGNNSSFGLSAWWSPEEAGWIPSVSAGYGFNSITNDDSNLYRSVDTQSWYVGLQWADAFMKGNTLGMAVGQPTFVTSVDYRNDFNNNSDFVADGNYAWEWWYQFQVTDNISVTPAIYYLSRPYGDLTDGRGTVVGGDRNDSTFSNFGGLVKTTFKF